MVVFVLFIVVVMLVLARHCDLEVIRNTTAQSQRLSDRAVSLQFPSEIGTSPAAPAPPPASSSHLRMEATSIHSLLSKSERKKAKKGKDFYQHD
uniref:Uncharacterized protein n=1 Tax=Physcomitrium patens TaxID=3218 RepID=A0A2K1IVH0_PHYPA|nr:hypothetical protein PHYPA_025215 [Physcomitrium patens]